MNRSIQSFFLIAIGFIVGFVVKTGGLAEASAAEDLIKASDRSYMVSINEIKETFVFGERFEGSYAKTITMSDGSVRNIVLRPVVKNGIELVEFRDGDGWSFMGPYGATTNGALMVQVWDLKDTEERFKTLVEKNQP